MKYTTLEHFCSELKLLSRLQIFVLYTYIAAMLSQEAATAVEDKGLQAVVASGVAYHHAALTPADRSCVERLFIAGDLAVVPQPLQYSDTSNAAFTHTYPRRKQHWTPLTPS